jgi:hypothetical protein
VFSTLNPSPFNPRDNVLDGVDASICDVDDFIENYKSGLQGREFGTFWFDSCFRPHLPLCPPTYISKRTVAPVQVLGLWGKESILGMDEIFRVRGIGHAPFPHATAGHRAGPSRSLLKKVLLNEFNALKICNKGMRSHDHFRQKKRGVRCYPGLWGGTSRAAT